MSFLFYVNYCFYNLYIVKLDNTQNGIITCLQGLIWLAHLSVVKGYQVQIPPYTLLTGCCVGGGCCVGASPAGICWLVGIC